MSADVVKLPTAKPAKKVAKKKELTAREWKRFRTVWENDPSLSYGAIAKMAHVARQTVQIRAKKEGWIRSLSGKEMQRRAHARADELQAEAPAEPEPQQAPAEESAEPAPFDASLAKAITKDAVEARAELVSRHRNEWNMARVLIYQAARTQDVVLGKHGKVITEGLKNLQEGERKAWGFDQDDPAPDRGRIIRG